MDELTFELDEFDFIDLGGGGGGGGGGWGGGGGGGLEEGELPSSESAPSPGQFTPIVVRQRSRRLVEIKLGQVVETRCSERVAKLLGDVPRFKRPRPEPFVPGNREAEIAAIFEEGPNSLAEKYVDRIFQVLGREMRTKSRWASYVFDYDDFKVPYSFGLGNPHEVLTIFLSELQTKRSVLLSKTAGDLYGVDFKIQRARAWSASAGAMRGIEVRFFW